MNDIENLLRLAGFEVVRRGTDILLPADVPASRAGRQPRRRQAPAPPRGLAGRLLRGPRGPPSTPSMPLARRLASSAPAEREGQHPRGGGAHPGDGPAHRADLRRRQLDRRHRARRSRRVIGRVPRPAPAPPRDQGDGKGKGDAVRKGFAAASNDVLMILDSDLTVPPEDLPKFYKALVTGKGEFINGVRLVYPMEGEAMRFLNLLGNKFFSAALSWLLEQPIKDSLCGTKVLYQQRLPAHRRQPRLLRRVRSLRRLRPALRRGAAQPEDRRLAGALPRPHLRRHQDQPLRPRLAAAQDDGLRLPQAANGAVTMGGPERAPQTPPIRAQRRTQIA